MARHKEYDREDVLEKATHLFWQKGFEATSMSDLVHATGLNSASMYKEFGNKEGLFDSALVHYRERWLEQFIRMLSENPNLKGVETYLAALQEYSKKPDFKGCLMINTIAEGNVVHQSALARVEKFCVRLESLLENALRNAQIQGDIPYGKNPQVLASYLSCFMHGLVLYGRPKDNKKIIPEIMELLLEQLRK